MAKLRKWTAYRTLERPYTRFSKFRKKGFVKSRPGKNVIKFDMGDLNNGPKNFPIKLQLIAKENVNIRANAIEAARISILRRIETRFGRKGFYFQLKCYPHHVIRENPLAAGAGADRLSTGMKHSFGKTIGTAARIFEGKVLAELYLPEGQEAIGRRALRVGSSKLPVKVTIQSSIKKVKKLTEEELLQKKVDEAKDGLRDAQEQLTKAQEALSKAENDEDKKSATEKVESTQKQIESAQHIQEIETKNLEEYRAKKK